MLVLGIDPHKATHTVVAVDEPGRQVGQRTVRARTPQHLELLAWARKLAGGRQAVWAVEDCRQVSRRLERDLLAAGERIVRVPPKLMAGVRRSVRTPGTSDPVDALAIARAALREPDLPAARLDEPTRELQLLLDHREDLVAERTRTQNRLRWHLHELDPDLQVPTGALDRVVWLERITQRLQQHPATLLVRIAAELVERCRALTARINQLASQLAKRVAVQAPRLLAMAGCGPCRPPSCWWRPPVPTGSSPRPPSRCTPGWRQSLPPPATPSGIGSTVAATGSSTPPCTGSP
jgi:transposase